MPILNRSIASPQIFGGVDTNDSKKVRREYLSLILILGLATPVVVVMNNAYGPMANVNFAGFATPGLPNQGYKLWLALVIMIACSGLTVAGRLATRISSRQVGADDVAIVAALVLRNLTAAGKKSHG